MKTFGNATLLVFLGSLLCASTLVAQFDDPPSLTVKIGFVIMFCAAAFNVGYHALNPAALPWTVLAVMLYSVGMALAVPSVQLIVLDLFPRLRGTASSLQGFAHSLFAGLTAGLVSPLVSGSGLTLAAAQATLVTLGCACWVLYRRVDGRAAHLAS